MAKTIQVMKSQCGFCREGNHEGCAIAIASVVPHVSNPDGVVWVCGCDVGVCDTVRRKCTECKNRNTLEVDPKTFQCLDRESCEGSRRAKREADPFHAQLIEIREKAQMAKVENATAKKVAAKKAAAPKEGTCVCGCAGKTKGGLFLPGHDARFVSQTVATVEDAKFTKASVDAGRAKIKGSGASETLIAKFDKAVGLAKARVEKKAKDAQDKAAAKAAAKSDKDKATASK